MALGNLVLTANVSGGPDGGRTFGPVTITTSAAVTAETLVSLANGANTVTVPSGATAVILFPPNASIPTPNPAFGGTLTLKGVSGDTGTTISNKWPTMLAFDTAPASFVINSTATGTLVAWWM